MCFSTSTNHTTPATSQPSKQRCFARCKTSRGAEAKIRSKRWAAAWRQWSQENLRQIFITPPPPPKINMALSDVFRGWWPSLNSRYTFEWLLFFHCHGFFWGEDWGNSPKPEVFGHWIRGFPWLQWKRLASPKRWPSNLDMYPCDPMLVASGDGVMEVCKDQYMCKIPCSNYQQSMRIVHCMP